MSRSDRSTKITKKKKKEMTKLRATALPATH